MELTHPIDLRAVFRQVGLDRQIPLRRQLSQKRHQFVGAGGGKPGGQHGLDMLKIAAGLQPPHRFPHGFLGAFFQNAGGGVSVHVHLAHIAGDARLFQLVHQNQGGVGVEGGKHAHPGRPVSRQFPCQLPVHCPGIVRVSKPGFCRERVGVEPVQQRAVHPHAQHGILGAVEMQVRKGLDDQAVSIVLHRRPGILLRQHRIHPGDDAVFSDEITVFRHIQPAADRRGNDIALENGGHKALLSKRKSARTAGAHSKILGDLIETSAPETSPSAELYELYFQLYFSIPAAGM